MLIFSEYTQVFFLSLKCLHLYRYIKKLKYLHLHVYIQKIYSTKNSITPVTTRIFRLHKPGASAAALGVTDRGVLRPGCFADITVFDPEVIAERATYPDPHQFATGIGTVLVNGEVVFEHGEHTGRLPGRIIGRG